MKITKVEAIPLKVDGTDDESVLDDLIIRIHTDAGITGIGEVDASPQVGKAVVDAPDMYQHSRGLATMLIGAHLLLYSTSPDADRRFFRDILEFRHVDVGGGWLIFKLPASELAVHPGDGAFVQQHGDQQMPGSTRTWG